MISPLFLAHGSPMLAIEDKPYSRFLQQLGSELHPKAVVIFTAHWEEEMTTVSVHDQEYETIYDFYGFPDELYQVQYPAKGSTEYAGRVTGLFEEHGIPFRTDRQRGLDHGSWTLLKHLFPKADIPVVQISVNPSLSPAAQFNIGLALNKLAAEDIAVIGSGVTVHNLRQVNWGAKVPDDWAVSFDDWLIGQLANGELQKLFRYKSEAPHAALAVPRAEHFVPFYIALGAGEAAAAKVIYRDYEFGNLSYLCMQFG